MKRIISLIIALAMFVAACSSANTEETQPSEVDATPSNENQFCVQVERTEVDFGVANDLHVLLQQRSVFYDEDISADKILNDTLVEMFSYLGVYANDIPEWARDIVDKEINRAETDGDDPDFSVLNQVYDELVEDPQYSDLKEPSRLEEFLEVVFKGIIEALGDPFSSYMRAEHWLTGFADNSGRYAGLGISADMNSRGEISISSIGEGTPAEAADLSIGDAVLEVNGLNTSSCTLQQFILQVRALENPDLELEIAREIPGSTERETLTINISKAEVKELGISTFPAVDLPNNRGSTLEGVPYRCGGRGVGLPCPFEDKDGDGVPDTLYVKIHEFSDQMRVDLEYALQQLDAEYDLDSFDDVVVDVRGNPGGLVSATMEAVDYFLETDDVIFIQRNKSTSGGEPVSVNMRQNRVTYIPEDAQIAILMDEESASGAEVFAAALRDNGRAVIVNDSDRSRGKGTVNVWYTLRQGEYGAVYVSIGMWLTPNGEFIETRDEDNDGYDELGGLTPDIHVPWSDADYSQNNRDVNYDPTLTAALEYLTE